jgi:hypothetical protein
MMLATMLLMTAAMTVELSWLAVFCGFRASIERPVGEA